MVTAVHHCVRQVAVTEQRVRLAEQALESWKQLDEDRKRLVSEREQQLRDLSEVRGWSRSWGGSS